MDDGINRLGMKLFAACCAFAALPAAAQDGNYVVVDYAGVKSYWTLAEKGEPFKLPASARKKRAEACVGVGFSIESDGKPANLTVLRSGFTDQADRQVIREVEQRVLQGFATTRYVATASNPTHRAIYTYGVVAFSMYEQPAIKEDVEKRGDTVQAPCRIVDFPAAVARGDLVRKAASP